MGSPQAVDKRKKAGKVKKERVSDPVENFEQLWQAFENRYAFFDVRGVDWKKQYDTYRPLVNAKTSDDELFKIMCRMLKPLNDGHVELKSKDPKRRFCAEDEPRFLREFSNQQINELFKVSEKTLQANGFSAVEESETWILRYARSKDYGYLRILELEGMKKKNLGLALNSISQDFPELKGYILDIRNCPGGDDSTLLEILGCFCDKQRVAFHRRIKNGPGDEDYGELRTWQLKPRGNQQFTGPIVLLTCDSVFSGGEIFALVARELPHLMIIGEHTNGIFSYQYDQRLPNGWKFYLSNQQYFSPNMVCYEGRGIPVDIEHLNTRADLEKNVDSLLIKAFEILRLPMCAQR
jgi:hypothetical protein